MKEARPRPRRHLSQTHSIRSAHSAAYGALRLTVKEEIGLPNAPALFSARGILAEFKIVGSFEMSTVPEGQVT